MKRLGGDPLARIRLRPYPATIQDVLDVQVREGRSCELVEGVLVEKVMGDTEALLAAWLCTLLNNFVERKVSSRAYTVRQRVVKKKEGKFGKGLDREGESGSIVPAALRGATNRRGAWRGDDGP